jgi:hypothetical protein
MVHHPFVQGQQNIENTVRIGERGQYELDEATSPPAIVPSARQVTPLSESLTNLAEASPISALAPPG